MHEKVKNDYSFCDIETCRKLYGKGALKMKKIVEEKREEWEMGGDGEGEGGNWVSSIWRTRAVI